jgi:hypothetical protein
MPKMVGTASTSNTNESAGNCGDVATSDWVVASLSTQRPTRAMPSSSLVSRTLPVTAPEPVAGVKVITAPPAGLPYRSRARTAGRSATSSEGTPS